jgi:SAM-dependent methyltransferase
VNWKLWRLTPWLDTRAAFVASVPRGGGLLDLGTSDGSTLSHFRELRPDLKLAAVDLKPSMGLPSGTAFQRADLERDRMQWPDSSFDAVTCMHLVEHLRSHANLFSETARVLKRAGRFYVETPSPMSLITPSAKGPAGKTVTMNFFDDATHVGIVPFAALSKLATGAGLTVVRNGVSRNWLFAIAYPFLLIFAPRSRKRWVAKLHWSGWSHYVIAEKPQQP